MKKSLCILFTFTLAFSCLAACSKPPQAQETTLSTAPTQPQTTENQTEILGGLALSGNAGEIKWELFHSGELVFSGEGEIPQDSKENSWVPYDEYIKTVIINDGITLIEEGVFSNMKSLEKVILPQTLNEIEEKAFSDCPKLREITLPDGVRTVNDYAFENSGLEKIRIGASVAEIGPLAFSGCKMTDIQVSEQNPFYSTDKYGVLFSKDKTSLVCYSLGFLMNSYSVPEGVTLIGENAFCNEYLSSIVLPKSLTEIGKNAFAGCLSLKSIEIPLTATEIGSGAFSGCRSIKQFTFPEGTEYIRDGVLDGCDSLEEINIPVSVVSIGESAFGSQATFKVNYNGSKEAWKKIYIAENNAALNRAAINYGLK